MTDEMLYGICLKCGHSHAPANRQRLIRPMIDELEHREILVLWSCFYGPSPAGERMLHRDKAAIRKGENA